MLSYLSALKYELKAILTQRVRTASTSDAIGHADAFLFFKNSEIIR